MTYLKVDNIDGTPRPIPEPGEVLFWEEGEHKEVVFCCPCGYREVYVVSPPHGISFDDDGRLTIKGSCGYRAHDDKPQNWCHFFIKNGEYEMCGDSKCPGKELI